jgi:hypothetical protein
LNLVAIFSLIVIYPKLDLFNFGFELHLHLVIGLCYHIQLLERRRSAVDAIVPGRSTTFLLLFLRFQRHSRLQINIAAFDDIDAVIDELLDGLRTFLAILGCQIIIDFICNLAKGLRSCFSMCICLLLRINFLFQVLHRLMFFYTMLLQ